MGSTALDDLEEHLVEAAAEGGAPLSFRLGPPAEYAAELRRAAGVVEPDAPADPTVPGWRAELGAAPGRRAAPGEPVWPAEVLPASPVEPVP